MGEKRLDFFLGCLSPCGYRGYFANALPPLASGKAIMLKGGPGCGKSTILRRVADLLLEQGETVHLIHCAADPDSLDGVICPGRQLAILDATPPHALEPQLPAAFEQVITLDAAVNAQQLMPSRLLLSDLSNQEALLTERATRYVCAAGSLAVDTLRAASCCTDTTKAARFAGALARRYLPGRATESESGREEFRLLSAVTPQGLTVYGHTIENLADTIIVLDDPYGAATKALMTALRQEILVRGLDCITCFDPLAPRERIDHLLLPGLRLAFVSSGPRCPLSFPGQRTIHASRFMVKDGLRARRTRLRFNEKSCKELLCQAGALLSEAGQVHRRMEQIYETALDFCAVDRMADALLKQL